jgi:hypothetical protein
VVSVVVFAIRTHALDNGIGARLTLGWNSWNIFAEQLDEQVVGDTVRCFTSDSVRVGRREVCTFVIYHRLTLRYAWLVCVELRWRCFGWRASLFKQEVVNECGMVVHYIHL